MRPTIGRTRSQGRFPSSTVPGSRRPWAATTLIIGVWLLTAAAIAGATEAPDTQPSPTDAATGIPPRLALPGRAAAAAAAEPWRIPTTSSTVGMPHTAAHGILPSRPADRDEGSDSRAWPQTTLRTVVSPVFHDLDDDGTLDVIAADDRYIRVFDHTGALRDGWPKDIGGSNLHAAVGDLTGDDDPEILIGSNFPTARLNAFDKNGTPLPGWPVDLPTLTFTNTTCPVIADIDGDGAPEAGIASEQGVSFFEADGTPVTGWPYLWPVPINNPMWSCPAVGDVDGDGTLEVAVGNACYPNWGVHLIRADGTAMPGWPKVIKPVYASPALADLDEDGDLEVIAQEGDPGSQGYRLWVWHHDGTTAAGWPKAIAAEGQSSRSNPAVADIDGDGTLEIVAVTSDGKLHILRPDGSYLPGYPRTTEAVQPIASPTVIDADGDGIQEIFLSYWRANAQYVSGWMLDGSVLTGFPKLLTTGTDTNSHASVHLADLEGDGDLDLTVASCSPNSGRVHVLEVDNSVYTPGVTREDWPKIRRDAENRGCFCDAEPTSVADLDARRTSLRVFPNPVRVDGRLLLQTIAMPSGRIEAFTTDGRRVGCIDLAARAARFSDSAEPSLRVSDLVGPAAPGVYLLRWSAEGSVASTRLVVLGR